MTDLEIALDAANKEFREVYELREASGRFREGMGVAKRIYGEVLRLAREAASTPTEPLTGIEQYQAEGR